jgi:hypothetical protein
MHFCVSKYSKSHINDMVRRWFLSHIAWYLETYYIWNRIIFGNVLGVQFVLGTPIHAYRFHLRKWTLYFAEYCWAVNFTFSLYLCSLFVFGPEIWSVEFRAQMSNFIYAAGSGTLKPLILDEMIHWILIRDSNSNSETQNWYTKLKLPLLISSHHDVFMHYGGYSLNTYL